jgi:hypothetical protein
MTLPYREAPPERAGLPDPDIVTWGGEFFPKLSIPYFLKKVYITNVNEQTGYTLTLMDN